MDVPLEDSGLLLCLLILYKEEDRQRFCKSTNVYLLSGDEI